MFKLEAFKRKYCDGATEVVTFRMPMKLKSKLQQYADQNGRSTTDVVMTVLDQFIQAIEEDSGVIKTKVKK